MLVHFRSQHSHLQVQLCVNRQILGSEMGGEMCSLLLRQISTFATQKNSLRYREMNLESALLRSNYEPRILAYHQHAWRLAILHVPQGRPGHC